MEGIGRKFIALPWMFANDLSASLTNRDAPGLALDGLRQSKGAAAENGNVYNALASANRTIANNLSADLTRRFCKSLARFVIG